MSLMQFADNTGPDQPMHKTDPGLHCPLTESMGTLVFVDEQNRTEQKFYLDLNYTVSRLSQPIINM